ncbi:hypothetical protein L6452_20371 [Arctium lappa]|uniref:Uncharacterized protein n=1 Tax=Arctium lappa TaxID=4217 RepID=A0ACB9BBQ2_ARCLA|nr:hypothetical protein L6452_20371 [Arctium lappa]
MDPSLSANEVNLSDVLESGDGFINVGHRFGSSTETNVPVSELFDEKGSLNHGKQLDEKDDRNGFSDSDGLLHMSHCKHSTSKVIVISHLSISTTDGFFRLKTTR